jgi:photosynthetic reaction center H subunit
MPHGALGGDVDVAQIMVVVFFIFFVFLIYHLRKEDKREGYPMKDSVGGADEVGFPLMPAPKTFRLLEGGVATAPHPEIPQVFSGRPFWRGPGSAIEPVGDPLQAGVGPAAWSMRKDRPLTFGELQLQVVPIRATDKAWSVVWADLDPRGMPVFAADKTAVGTVIDLWVDRSVKILRYLEIELSLDGAAGRRILAPIYHAHIKPRPGRVRLIGIPAASLPGAPGLASPDQITAREEDRVNAFFAGARFFRPVLEPRP